MFTKLFNKIKSYFITEEYLEMLEKHKVEEMMIKDWRFEYELQHALSTVGLIVSVLNKKVCCFLCEEILVDYQREDYVVDKNCMNEICLSYGHTHEEEDYTIIRKAVCPKHGRLADQYFFTKELI